MTAPVAETVALERLDRDVSAVTGQTDGLVIVDHEGYLAAVQLRAGLKKLERSAADSQAEITRPMREAADRVRSLFAPHLSRLSTALKAVDDAMKRWNKAEDERKATEAKRLQAAADAAVEDGAPAAIEYVEPTSNTTKAGPATSWRTKTWTLLPTPDPVLVDWLTLAKLGALEIKPKVVRDRLLAALEMGEVAATPDGKARLFGLEFEQRDGIAGR